MDNEFVGNLPKFFIKNNSFSTSLFYGLLPVPAPVLVFALDAQIGKYIDNNSQQVIRISLDSFLKGKSEG